MADAQPLEPISIESAFPPGDPAAEWVVTLTMAMNDLTTLDSRIHHALDNDRPDASYYFRLLCGTLRELWRLFDVARTAPEVQALVARLVPEARQAYDRARLLFVRPAPSQDDPTPRSWAELHLKDVRDRTFHYPQVGSTELRDAITSAGHVPARIREEGRPVERQFEYADVIALHAAFGDINEVETGQRFEEIVTTAKLIATLLVPVSLNGVGNYLRARGIDPARLKA
jgi:hypothetical protein